MDEYQVMLAPSKLADITNLKYPVLIQPKYDGFRATYIPGKGLISRTGKSFRNKYLSEYFSNMYQINDIVLDGELYIPNIPFQELSSTISAENVKITLPLRFMVFDAVPLHEWEKRSSDQIYASRLTLMRETLNRISDYSRVLDTPTDKVNNTPELLTIYKEYLTDNLEGIMIKEESGLYKWGRLSPGKQVQKLKPFKSQDLLVTGVYDGNGKLEGTIGGIICDYKGSELRVGTGFTMADRKEISSNSNKFIGKIAEIKYLEATKDGKSLRHPVFARWRFDK